MVTWVWPTFGMILSVEVLQVRTGGAKHPSEWGGTCTSHTARSGPTYDSTLPSPMSSGGIRWTLTGMLEFRGIPSGIHWNGWNLPFHQIPMESKWNSIPTDSNGIQVEFHSNRFQVHSAGFQGPFQHIPTHSNPFQPIPWAIPTLSKGHSNIFQWIPSAIQMSCDLVWTYFDNLILRVPYSIWVWLVKTKIYWKQLPKVEKL